MTKHLQSGRRRDLCVLLAGAGELNGQALKSRLESHYGERIEPRSFYGALETVPSQWYSAEGHDFSRG